MPKQHEIRSPKGARKPSRRVGRGNGSGRGTYSGRGMKGAGARAGTGAHRGFQGWQNPWIKAMPKKHGFRSPNPRNFNLVNLKSLERHFETGEEVTPQRMVEKGLVRDLKLPVKILGDGEISKVLTVAAHRFSATAQEKLQAAGGTVQLLVESKQERRAVRAG